MGGDQVQLADLDGRPGIFISGEIQTVQIPREAFVLIFVVRRITERTGAAVAIRSEFDLAAVLEGRHPDIANRKLGVSCYGVGEVGVLRLIPYFISDVGTKVLIKDLIVALHLSDLCLYDIRILARDKDEIGIVGL